MQMGSINRKDVVWRLKCVQPFRIAAGLCLMAIGVGAYFLQTHYYDYYHNLICGAVFIFTALIGLGGSLMESRSLLILHVVLSTLCCLLLYPANIGLSVFEMWCDMGSDKCKCRVDHCDKQSRRLALAVEIGSFCFASILLLLNMMGAVNGYYVWAQQRPSKSKFITYKVEALIRAVTPSTHIFLNTRLARQDSNKSPRVEIEAFGQNNDEVSTPHRLQNPETSSHHEVETCN